MAQFFFDINTSNGVPVYEQVARQIVSAIASGGLDIGQMVPSVREMAKELAINPNTVSRAYRQLQDSGVLETVRGSGVAVSKGAKAQCKKMRSQAISARIAHVIVEARQSQLTDEEILKMINSEMRKKHPQ